MVLFFVYFCATKAHILSSVFLACWATDAGEQEVFSPFSSAFIPDVWQTLFFLVPAFPPSAPTRFHGRRMFDRSEPKVFLGRSQPVGTFLLMSFDPPSGRDSQAVVHPTL